MYAGGIHMYLNIYICIYIYTHVFHVYIHIYIYKGGYHRGGGCRPPAGTIYMKKLNVFAHVKRTCHATFGAMEMYFYADVPAQ